MIISIVLGYGYWHSISHAYFYTSLQIEDKIKPQHKNTSQASVQFLDSHGNFLAKGVSDEQYNYVRLIHPVFGDCHEVEKKAAFSIDARKNWQECFENLSTWVAKWIGKVYQVNLEFEDCLQQNIPITVSSDNSSWYMWWVPHPHIGGKPYSYYSSTITVDKLHCVKNNVNERAKG